MERRVNVLVSLETVQRNKRLLDRLYCRFLCFTALYLSVIMLYRRHILHYLQMTIKEALTHLNVCVKGCREPTQDGLVPVEPRMGRREYVPRVTER